eukprot:GAHX01000105.1.p1 GENE.GAHX01000105.1~~GAHX01000105.1.p1  ORF type:complete len:259 (+),score=42.15 GAHX01000105.1:48-824(+)
MLSSLYQDKTSLVDENVLDAFLKCRLCDSYFADAHSLISCLHTFCKYCILAYIKDKGYKFKSKNKLTQIKCPVCFISITITDDCLDTDLRPDYIRQELADSLSRIILDDEYTPTPEPLENNHVELVTDVEEKNSLIITANDVLQDKLGVLVVFSPSEKPLCRDMKQIRKPYVLLPRQVDGRFLKEYLAALMQINNFNKIQLFCNGYNIGDDQSLEFVRRAVWKTKDYDMIIYYKENLTFNWPSKANFKQGALGVKDKI